MISHMKNMIVSLYMIFALAVAFTAVPRFQPPKETAATCAELHAICISQPAWWDADDADTRHVYLQNGAYEFHPISSNFYKLPKILAIPGE